ncbi:MAG: YqgE/AlgH family protein [Gammaproteobacteria bacterium]|nr:YqgE/AlgH family protein [Gammaproteobacteria bacterium]
MTILSFKNQLLIAMPSLQDGYFDQSVAIICEHNEQGALGIVINKNTPDITLLDVLEQSQVAIPPMMSPHEMVYLGGPVQPEQGFVLHTPIGEWSSSLRVSDELALTTSRDILANLGTQLAPQHFLVAVGYAGWGAGQLEREIAENYWLTAEVSLDILFTIPPLVKRSAAVASLGITLDQLIAGCGHA